MTSKHPNRPYEVFEHTADVGINAYGATPADLFIHTAQGMESLMVDPEQIRTQITREITVEGHDTVSLLIDWLNEFIFLFDTEHLLFREFQIDVITETRVAGRAIGEAYDVHRHELGSAIKAVTWHEAAVTRLPEPEQQRSGYRYQAHIIFDI
ncbi:MAG TPA: archease [Ktedonobacteraceae bacterium]|jgi:SHS2 domain-containing protein|nr:archease [Ktedonobacteraceae bacterium]